MPYHGERSSADRRPPKVPQLAGPAEFRCSALAALRALPGHHFWPDKISIADDLHVHVALLSSHSRVTDSYLLALARAHGGRLASMDHRLAVDAVPGGAVSLALI